MTEMHWIPVTERMPEKDGRYLVTFKYCRGCHNVIEAKFQTDEVRKKSVRRWHLAGRLFPVEWDILAWMPLPEPYKEGKNV